MIKNMSKISQQPFGKTREGKSVDQFTITNRNGLEAKLTNYGATIVGLRTPDKNGELSEITLGFDSIDGYLGDHPFYGCIAGRYANRIRAGEFVLAGAHHKLALNDHGNHLHGGNFGFNRKIWEPTIVGQSVVFSLLSPDGDEGYPGNLSVQVAYALTDQNSLSLHYRVTTDARTVHNLTNHTYFNLDGCATILDHDMMLNADRFTPTDAGLIPTGEIASVDGTPLDFRQSTRIGDRIHSGFEALNFAGGYDHNWIINGATSELNLAARASSRVSGRVLECYTDQPAIQFYAGNMIAPGTRSRSKIIGRNAGFCLETQHYPDSPNIPNFPSTVLDPGDVFQSTTVYRFSVSS